MRTPMTRRVTTNHENGHHVQRPAGAGKRLKFLGMGVWGKALLSRRAFPQKYIFIEKALYYFYGRC